MSTLVIDASVAIKWIVPEPGTDQALSLRRHRLLAPELLVAECANALWKKVRRREFTKQEADLAARTLELAELELFPMRRLLGAATELATSRGPPAYECFYLALAAQLGCDFVTADTHLARKRVPPGFVPRVIPLGTADL